MIDFKFKIIIFNIIFIIAKKKDLNNHKNKNNYINDPQNMLINKLLYRNNNNFEIKIGNIYGYKNWENMYLNNKYKCLDLNDLNFILLD